MVGAFHQIRCMRGKDAAASRVEMREGKDENAQKAIPERRMAFSAEG
jgi:hypothetical protein